MSSVRSAPAVFPASIRLFACSEARRLKSWPFDCSSAGAAPSSSDQVTLASSDCVRDGEFATRSLPSLSSNGRFSVMRGGIAQDRLARTGRAPSPAPPRHGPRPGSMHALGPEDRLFHFEVTDHPAHEVDVAAVGVFPLLQPDLPASRAGEGHARLLAQAGAEKMEVVNRALVADGDLVGAGLERLHGLAALGQVDCETGA